MLADYVAVPTLAVKDLQSARQFYEGVLGFSSGREGPGGIFYSAGSSSFFVYESSYAGTNKATAVSFQVDDGAFDNEVKALRDKGVQFQTFEMEGVNWNDGVATFGDEPGRSVWFEDPDGNILNVESM